MVVPQDVCVRRQRGSMWTTVNTTLVGETLESLRKRGHPNLSQHVEETVGKHLGEATWGHIWGSLDKGDFWVDFCSPSRLAIMAANPVTELVGKQQGHPG